MRHVYRAWDEQPCDPFQALHSKFVGNPYDSKIVGRQMFLNFHIAWISQFPNFQKLVAELAPIWNKPWLLPGEAFWIFLNDFLRSRISPFEPFVALF